MKKEEAVWCASPEAFLDYKNAPSEDRIRYTTCVDPGLDMSTCGWIKVGTAVIHYTFAPVDDGLVQAMAACDLAESKLREELNDKLAGILEIRQQLLCLPAPKEDDDE